MPELLCVEAGPVATNGYLLLDAPSARACVVDVPHGSADWFVDMAAQRSCTITDILLTHTHWDHTADVVPLVRATGARVHVHPDDAFRMRDPMPHTIWPLPFTIEGMEPDTLLHHGGVIDLGWWKADILHVPGHSEGSVCFFARDHGYVLVGDTLFAGSVGRTDLPGGDHDQLLTAITTRLMTLSDDVAVLPGHGPSTTIGHERRSNPFLQGR